MASDLDYMALGDWFIYQDQQSADLSLHSLICIQGGHFWNVNTWYGNVAHKLDYLGWHYFMEFFYKDTSQTRGKIKNFAKVKPQTELGMISKTTNHITFWHTTYRKYTYMHACTLARMHACMHVYTFLQNNYTHTDIAMNTVIHATFVYT